MRTKIMLFESFKDFKNIEFKKWFKDSKVVGKDNMPMVMYHGSPHVDDISEFENDKGYSFFTSSQYEASRYTGRGEWDEDYVMSFYIRAEKIFNPLDMSEQEKTSVYSVLEAHASDLLQKYHNNFHDFEGLLEDNMGYVDGFEYEKASDFEKCVFLLTKDVDNYVILESPHIQHWIVSNGYDSFQTIESGGNDLNIAVYHPNQIKSIYNEGNFSLQRNNIFESK
jgi:hypothetical protein